MAFAGFTMMNLLWISIALYSGADKGEFRTLFHWVGFALATPALLYSGYPFYRGAWNGLRNLYLGMDLPIAIGASVTYLYSLYVTLSGSISGEVYYDTVVNFLFVILLGRYLEASPKTGSRIDSTPARSATSGGHAGTGWRGEGCTHPFCKTRKSGSGETGERIPVDGTISEGSARSMKRCLPENPEGLRNRGRYCLTGTINGNGPLMIRVEGC